MEISDIELSQAELDELEVAIQAKTYNFKVGDKVVYPHHGAGMVLKKEKKMFFEEKREYLTIKILNNDMTVKVPCENAAAAGLRPVIDENTVNEVISVLQDVVSEMPGNWNRRFKYNREKMRTGDIFELAEVIRNLAALEAEKGLSSGEKQMFVRAKKILSSELMYALDMTEEEAEAHVEELIGTPETAAVVA
ncbi:MAG: CarD family transcriptional regulator [Thermoleophilaceae bacterium]|nr:CarD family transcriptional regulator [Thermoleophilaceae bacterium]